MFYAKITEGASISWQFQSLLLRQKLNDAQPCSPSLKTDVTWANQGVSVTKPLF